MSTKTLLIVAGLVTGVLLLNFAKNEYSQAKTETIGAIKSVVAAVESLKSTSDTVREAIDDIRDRLAKLESATGKPYSEIVDQLDAESTKRQQLEAELKQAKESLQLSKVSSPKIVMHTSPTCGPCQVWKRDYMPLWVSKGWQVEIIEEQTTDKSWPWFEVFDNGKRFEVIGMLDQQSYYRAKARQQGEG